MHQLNYRWSRHANVLCNDSRTFEHEHKGGNERNTTDNKTKLKQKQHKQEQHKKKRQGASSFNSDFPSAISSSAHAAFAHDKNKASRRKPKAIQKELGEEAREAEAEQQKTSEKTQPEPGKLGNKSSQNKLPTSKPKTNEVKTSKLTLPWLLPRRNTESERSFHPKLLDCVIYSVENK